MEEEGEQQPASSSSSSNDLLKKFEEPRIVSSSSSLGSTDPIQLLKNQMNPNIKRKKVLFDEQFSETPISYNQNYMNALNIIKKQNTRLHEEVYNELLEYLHSKSKDENFKQHIIFESDAITDEFDNSYFEKHAFTVSDTTEEIQNDAMDIVKAYTEFRKLIKQIESSKRKSDLYNPHGASMNIEQYGRETVEVRCNRLKQEVFELKKFIDISIHHMEQLPYSNEELSKTAYAAALNKITSESFTRVERKMQEFIAGSEGVQRVLFGDPNNAVQLCDPFHTNEFLSIDEIVRNIKQLTNNAEIQNRSTTPTVQSSPHSPLFSLEDFKVADRRHQLKRDEHLRRMDSQLGELEKVVEMDEGCEEKLSNYQGTLAGHTLWLLNFVTKYTSDSELMKVESKLKIIEGDLIAEKTRMEQRTKAEKKMSTQEESFEEWNPHMLILHLYDSLIPHKELIDGMEDLLTSMKQQNHEYETMISTLKDIHREELRNIYLKKNTHSLLTTVEKMQTALLEQTKQLEKSMKSMANRIEAAFYKT